MTTLVTGATGFLGSHVARQLVARGERVKVLVRASSGTRALEGLSAERVTGDLRDTVSLRNALEGITRVFHVAADYRLWAKDPREIYESNVTGTKNLLQAAKEAGVERFIHTSTVATIAVPRQGALPNEETRATLAEMIGEYKRSKFLAEQEALRAAENGLPVVVVNPTTPVGPGDWKPTPTGKIILDFINGRLRAFVDTGLNLVPVEDAAAGHLLAAERGTIGQRYLLGARNMTLEEILGVLARVTGRRPPRLKLPHAVAMAAGYADEFFSRLVGREPQIPLDGVRMARHRMFVDCSKAQRELGFVAGSVEEALERAARWYEVNGYVTATRGRHSIQAAAA